MEDFIKVDYENKVQSLKYTRKDGYWKHFEFIKSFYYFFLQDHPCDSATQEIFSHYISNCSLNFTKGIVNVIGCHHTDSSKEDIIQLDECHKLIEEDYEKVLNRVSLRRY